MIHDTCTAVCQSKGIVDIKKERKGSLQKKKTPSYLEQLLVIHFQDRLAGTRKGHTPQQLGSLKRQRVHVFGGGPIHNPLASEGGTLGLGLGRSLREHTSAMTDTKMITPTNTSV